MINVGNLMAYLELDTGNFTQKLAEAKSQSDNFSGQMKSLGEGMTSLGQGLTLGLTTPIIGGFGASAKAAIDFESAFAGVRKTVDASEEEFAMLENGIRGMAKELPATAVDIAAVAEAAGQLGIENDNILDFSRTMIDLGESTNLTADQAATAFARFANITQMPQDKMSNLGSAVVELGNNFATTEAEIVDMGMKLSGTGSQIGLTEAEIMGLATAMSSVGINAEAGGTAMSMVLNKMNNALASSKSVMQDFEYVADETGMSVEQLKNYVLGGNESIDALSKSTGISKEALKELAKDYESAVIPAEGFAAIVEQGGMAADDFVEKWSTSPSEVLEAFVAGLAKIDEEGGNVNLVLKELGINGVRETDTLNRLLGAAGLLPEAFEMANKAFEENNALTKEAEQRYQTTASQIEIAKNNITDAAITLGNELIPYIVDASEWVKNLATGFSELDSDTQKAIITFGGIAAALGPALIVGGKIVGAIGAISGALAPIGGIAAKALGTAGLAGSATAAGTAVGIGGGGLAGALTAGLGALNPWVGAAVVAGGAILAIADGLNQQVIPAFNLFDQEISRSTRESVESFLELEQGARSTFELLKITGTEVTQEMADGVITNITGMKDQLLTTLEEQKTSAISTLTAMVEESKTLSDEEKEAMVANATEMYEKKQEIIQNGADRITEIYQLAADENRTINETEKIEINTIQTQMKEDGIRILSETEAEYAVIRQRMKDQSINITTEQVAELIKKSIELKDETIKAAEEEYNERIKYAEQLKMEGTKEAEELANKVIEEAGRQRDESVKAAEEMHRQVIEHAEAQAGEHISAINRETGELMSIWQKTVSWFANNPIVQSIKTVSDNVQAKQKSYAGTGLQSQYYYETKYSSGTNYSVGGRALVGEHGPEYVDLPKGSKVYNASQSSKMGGTFVINNYYNMSDVTIREQADVNNLSSEIEKKQIRDMRARGLLPV